jgi:hypothetical protein
MNFKSFAFLIVILLDSSCVTIPKETVILSKTMGNDLDVLLKSHKYCVELYFNQIKEDINKFVDDVFTPFIVHYVLKDEWQKYQSGDTSIFRSVELAAQKKGNVESEIALTDMTDFISETQFQIDSMRNYLLEPVLKQEEYLLKSIGVSYGNVIHANATITGYLESIRKVKEAQQEALATIGLSGADTALSNNLVKISDLVDRAVKEGKKIDVKSDLALKEITDITKQIRMLTNKN